MRTFRDAGITGDFVHEPLQNVRSEIRLIHIKPSDVKNDEIECMVPTHALNKAPELAMRSFSMFAPTSTTGLYASNASNDSPQDGTSPKIVRKHVP